MGCLQGINTLPVFEIDGRAILEYEIRVLQDCFPVSDAMLVKM
jgi:hypothetical protein